MRTDILSPHRVISKESVIIGSEERAPMETRKSPVVMMNEIALPGTANHFGTVFGGRVLQLMDMSGYLAANKFFRMEMVTASISEVHFLNPIYISEIMEFQSKVVYTGTKSITTRVVVTAENQTTGERRLCCDGYLIYVPLGKDKKPVQVPQLLVETEEEKAEWERARAIKERLAAIKKVDPSFHK